jgi:hypothetical protein
MDKKQKLIQRMLELQRTFIAYERQQGVNLQDYYCPESGHTLKDYRQEYAALATQVIDLAHEEKGSKR